MYYSFSKIKALKSGYWWWETLPSTQN